MNVFKLFLLAAASSVAACALAQDEAPMQRVEVPGEFSSEQSYRRMLRGVEKFDSLRAQAPNAVLRFRMFGTERDVKPQTLRLALESASLKLPLAHDDDASFALPVNETAQREDAALVSNRRTGSVYWKPQVITPGLPADTRRLGDLRVQCQVTYASGLQHGGMAFLTKMMGQCGANVPFFFLADREIFAVTVEAPGRERHLFSPAMPDNAVTKLPRQRSRYFHPPIEEELWPDDALVRIYYVDGDAQPSSNSAPVFEKDVAGLVPGQTRKADLQALLARGKSRQLSQGREMWTLLERAPLPGKEKIDSVAELALLFDAEGVLRKHQVRAALVERKSLKIVADGRAN
ncbi:hypothetical protein [Pseudoduganella sp. OTU4001]|uniref:hypothetical protein n=1 Tax=Pseudoduganella sp. OTU4001 TaxID=3043854 RepID=UPI00313EC689